MNIQQRTLGDVAVLDLDGKIIGGADSEAFQQTVDTLLQGGTRHFLVNLEKVNWINSTGLGTLIAAFTAVRKEGGKLKLVQVSERIQSLLKITRLSSIIESYDNEADALASFS